MYDVLRTAIQVHVADLFAFANHFLPRVFCSSRLPLRLLSERLRKAKEKKELEEADNAGLASVVVKKSATKKKGKDDLDMLNAALASAPKTKAQKEVCASGCTFVHVSLSGCLLACTSCC